MRIKIILLTFLLFSAAFFLPAEAQASEVPSASITLSDEIYADLAIRNELNHIGLYYFDGNIDNTVSMNTDKNWDPASTVKLYVAMYAFDQIMAGKLSLDQIVTISDKNIAPSVSVEGGYAPSHIGDQVSVYELLDRMITQSGNTSYNTLLDLLDRREVTKYIHDIGLVNSSVGAKLNLDSAQEAIEMTSPGFGPNVTNAEDFARAFILINGKRIPGSPALFDMLSRQKLNEMIPAYLPKNVVVAHKTGELDPYYHDGGIVVDANKKYILSIFSDAGDPSLIAHISQLVYTKDPNLIGSSTSSAISEEPLPPVDSLVNEAGGRQVLAAVTQNVKLPAITASDIGIQSSDLTSVLDKKQLPIVVIPTDSPLHFLVDVGNYINSNLNPIAPLKLSFEASNLKLKLAEAGNLSSRGKVAEARALLGQVDSTLSKISKDKGVSENADLQTTLNQVSETRFGMLKDQLAKTSGPDRILAIKEIARQARNAADSVVPNVPKAIEKEGLVQAPVIGKVTAVTTNTITVRTPTGGSVTVETPPQVKTRDASVSGSIVKPLSQIPVGSEVAVAGTSPGGSKGTFVMTNLPVDSETQTPVSVVKVNVKDNTLVVSKNGVPTQVDVTKQTILKGPDDAVSLDNIKPGDILVVHGTDVNVPSASSSAGQVTAPVVSSPAIRASGSPVPGVAASPTPSIKTNAPISATNAPVQQKTVTKTTAPVTQQKNKVQPPPVIKGKVIEIVGSSVTPVKSEPSKKTIPNPIPPATPVPEEKKR